MRGKVEKPTLDPTIHLVPAASEGNPICIPTFLSFLCPELLYSIRIRGNNQGTDVFELYPGTSRGYTAWPQKFW